MGLVPGRLPADLATAAAGRSCGASHRNIGGATIADYSPHHEPFMYYASTANQHHLPPTSVANIGHSDQAKHQYDLADFDDAVKADNLPQVSFLKAAQFEDGHPGSSDPLDEQSWIARVVDEVQQSPDWASTAIVITYDDSDGWYDHVNARVAGLQRRRRRGGLHRRAGPRQPGLPGPLRAGPAAPDPGGLAVGEGQPRRPHAAGAGVGHAVHRGQLEPRADRRRARSTRARAGALQSMFDFDVGDARAPKVYLDPATGQASSARRRPG